MMKRKRGTHTLISQQIQKSENGGKIQRVTVPDGE